MANPDRSADAKPATSPSSAPRAGLPAAFARPALPLGLSLAASGILLAATAGTWTMEVPKGKDRVQLTLERTTEGGGRSTNGFQSSFSAFQGLTRDQVDSAGSPVRFHLTRDAGTVAFEGYFKQGKGSG